MEDRSVDQDGKCENAGGCCEQVCVEPPGADDGPDEERCNESPRDAVHVFANGAGGQSPPQPEQSRDANAQAHGAQRTDERPQHGRALCLSPSGGSSDGDE